MVAFHAEEVLPMLERLGTVNDADRLAEAVETVRASGARFKFASELEAAILARLGHRLTDSHQRADKRRMRRVRGLACPQCFDTGWTEPDAELVTHPCDCTPRPAPELDPTAGDRPSPGSQPADDETAYDALRAARAALHHQGDDAA